MFDMPLEKMWEYKPELSRNEDFNSFWKETIADSRKQELNVEIKAVEYPVEEVRVYDLYYDGFKIPGFTADTYFQEMLRLIIRSLQLLCFMVIITTILLSVIYYIIH